MKTPDKELIQEAKDAISEADNFTGHRCGIDFHLWWYVNCGLNEIDLKESIKQAKDKLKVINTISNIEK